MLAAISFVTTPQAVANVRLADVRMATSWYDSGQRLDGAVAAAPPPATATAAVSAGASPVDRKFSGSNIYEPGSTAPWGFQSRARRSDDDQAAVAGAFAIIGVASGAVVVVAARAGGGGERPGACALGRAPRALAHLDEAAGLPRGGKADRAAGGREGGGRRAVARVCPGA